MRITQYDMLINKQKARETKRARLVRLGTGKYRVRIWERYRGFYRLQSSLFTNAKNLNKVSHSNYEIEITPNKVSKRRSYTRTINQEQLLTAGD